MTENQLDNLICFCFNFHVTMDSNPKDHNSQYILEKYNKYIGIIPKDLGNKEFIDIDLDRGTAWMTSYKNLWKVENYNKVKEILHFLFVINTRPLIVRHHWNLPDGMEGWSPSELIGEFEKWIGDPEQINKGVYNHLHEIVNREIKDWLSEKSINRDYKLNILNIE
jgi:hypothetical protein